MNMKKGFTLIEIMIVVAIIAILAAIAIPNFIAYRQTAQANSCKGNIKQLQAAVEAYQIKYNKYPTGLADLTSDSDGGVPIMKSTPTCPFASATYEYNAGDDTKAATITCPSANTSTHKVTDGSGSAS